MATEQNTLRKDTLRRLRQELVANVEPANNLLHELNRYIEQLRTRASELLRVEALPDHPLTKYGFSAYKGQDNPRANDTTAAVVVPLLTASDADFEAYEQFQSLNNQEAGGSRSASAPKKKRTYIPREREESEQRLLDDYYGDEDTPPKYLEENFKRSGLSIVLLLKCTSAICQFPYDTTPDSFEEYLKIVERCARKCLENFTKCIYILYVEEFLRNPTSEDIKNIYALHEEKLGLLGMLGSIDCMHCDWRNFPKSLHGQFKRCDHKYTTVMLEAVANQKL
nr:hypothetical protein [Tanacetum cinerariifolium]